MSAPQAAAREALAVVDEVVHEEPDSVSTSTYALLGIGRSLLACAEELEALVELLRERLPVPRVPQVGDRLEPGAVYVNLDGVEPSAMASALAAAVRRGYGSSTSAAPRDEDVQRDGAESCGFVGDSSVSACGIRYDEHHYVRDHEWIRA